MKQRKILALVLVIVFILGCLPAYAKSPNEVDKLKKQQKELKQQIEQINKAIKDKKKETKNVSGQIAELDKRLNEAERQLSNVEGQLSNLEGQITITSREYQRAKETADGQKALLKKRVRVMYENGPVGYLNVILDSKSFADFISRLDYLKKIVSYDTKLLKTMKDYENKVAQTQNKLKAEQAEKQQLRELINGTRQNVASAKEGKQKVLKDLTDDLKELEKQEDELLEQAEALGKKIVALQGKGKYVGGKLGWPAPGHYTITSGYGYRMHPVLKKKKLHTGIDIGAPQGADIVAANSGKVIFAGYYGGYGNAVIIDHGGHISTLYAHSSKLLVSEGDTVDKGQVIAKVGSTGLSTGPHLHFEVRVNGQHVDPMGYLGSK